ncbi:VPLPA-CTERM sorting domain-containing protein [Parvularcula sp. ZS-1/3]|uniref:VPLPA-CTERM sorting domain-containing protein n=1 Tax=Parvularcula mediterranea TaxID=2732508 RepID=A0A7Y3W538_9PROT|nr:VPLPA-CTERM sorting domain-containing protein [Parvularcula mediterranea]NNU15892.1 VPLPA-CTERM sorting domain-containing protein [Parvularcula mediterranea]
MLNKLLSGLAAAAAAFGMAQAGTYIVEQETSAGSNVFTTVATIQSYDGTTRTTAGNYNLSNASYNGRPGLPVPVADGVMMFIVDSSTGPALFMVFDGISDSTRGNAAQTIEMLSGSASVAVSDDGSESASVSGNTFSYGFRWAGCCTDGLALDLSGMFSLEQEFQSFSGLSSFLVFSEGEGSTQLELGTGLATRISAVPVPAAGLLLVTGLAGLGLRKRRQA